MCYGRLMSLTDTIPRPNNTSPLSEVVRRNIRGAIVRAAYTQASFATDALRKNTSWLSRRVRGNNPTEITIDELQTIASALGVSPEDLLHR